MASHEGLSKTILWSDKADPYDSGRDRDKATKVSKVSILWSDEPSVSRTTGVS